MSLPYYDYVEEDFGSYPLIPGLPLYRNDILKQPDHIQDVLAEQLGTFLNEIHTLSVTGENAHKIGSSNVNRNREVWLTLFEDVQRVLFPSMMPHARDWTLQHFEPLQTDACFMDYKPVLINGDLPPYHILWDAQEQMITGIIDWGTAGLGDPASDFACLLYNYGETFVQRMVPFYPGIEELIDRARFWAGTLELQWALSSVRQENKLWRTVHIGSAKDVQPIGSAL